ncbi:MAG: LysM peptidoglycan-binding domain-containing protein [Fuerstiella sp.]|nr:LysM peptidoglycan-binding domain-containing protein [Fuerstiella sp.]
MGRSIVEDCPAILLPTQMATQTSLSLNHVPAAFLDVSRSGTRLPHRKMFQIQRAGESLMAGATNETDWAADRKVGFAMGILLIGVVAALFFRNEPLSVENTPSVAREELIESRLRDRNISVYADDRDAAPDESNHAWTLPELFDQFEQQDAGVVLPIGQGMSPGTSNGEDEDSQNRVNSPTRHESLAFAPPTTAAAPPNERFKSEVCPDSFSFADEPGVAGHGNAGRAMTEYIEYTIQNGDTLSGIADKLLGSPDRYQEIYEINRDRMASPDHLRVGAAIKIPR